MGNRHTQTRNRYRTNPYISAEFTAKQRQFLDAYSTRPWMVADAARVAGCHRCSVYRWREDSPAFAQAMRASEEAENRRRKEQADEWWRQMRAKWKAEAKVRTAEALLRLRKQFHRRR